MDEIDSAVICKALSDATTLQIVRRLTKVTKGEQWTCDLQAYFKISQPTLTHHMRILADCVLLSSRKDDNWNFYSLNCETLKLFRDFIATLDCKCQEVFL